MMNNTQTERSAVPKPRAPVGGRTLVIAAPTERPVVDLLAALKVSHTETAEAAAA
jgi:hypothetical protein